MRLSCIVCAYLHRYFISTLAALVLITLFFLAYRAPFVYGDNTINVSAKVLAPAPEINTPAQTSVNIASMYVKGKCTPRAIVKVFNNGVLSGEQVCGLSHTFRINILLVSGENNVSAAHYAPELASDFSPSVQITASFNKPSRGENKFIHFISMPIYGLQPHKHARLLSVANNELSI